MLTALGATLLVSGCMQAGPTQRNTGAAASDQSREATVTAATILPVAPSSLAPPASAEAGQKIAIGGAANGVAACVSCRGAQGEGNAAGGFPRIAGQPEYYLFRQMKMFANGSRNNPVMSPIAKALSEQQMRDVSVYYALLATPVTNKTPRGGARLSPAMITRGQVLASAGDQSERVQACANCHGPGGAGEAPSFPYLAGQHATYLGTAMKEWKSGNRNSDPSQQMPAIAKLLSDQDIAALAAFYSVQPAPPPAGRVINVASGSAARPSVPAKPRAAGSKAPTGTGLGQGTGSESGTAITGGSQGPGGGGGATDTQPESQP